jgi:hypothetical protein
MKLLFFCRGCVFRDALRVLYSTGTKPSSLAQHGIARQCVTRLCQGQCLAIKVIRCQGHCEGCFFQVLAAVRTVAANRG